MKSIAAVSIAILHEGRFLLVRRGRGHARGLYAFPGGRVETGETAAMAVRRELAEETGIEVAELALYRTIELEAGTDRFELAVFRGSRPSGVLAAGDDADEAGWFTLDAMRRLPITGSTLEIAAEIATMDCGRDRDTDCDAGDKPLIVG